MSADSLPRTALPIPDRRPPGVIGFDASKPGTTYPPIKPLRPPAGAPNVLVVLLDDVGFGASSAFGGPCATPVAERVAAQGLRYNRFCTTAMCSPTRAALLSGRNHHTVGMGTITEMATSAPGASSIRPNTCAPLAEILRLNGYSTAQLGKCHEVPPWETSPMGPFDRWPSPGGGFEYFYGFLGAESNQYYPALYENTVPIEPERTPEEGYHLMEDLADRAIGWIQSQQALMPDKPFFMYFAPGATHAPHHVPKEWADRYQGQFDQGWDRVREETLARQQALGIVPPDAELSARPDVLPAWDDMPDQLKPVLARQMEVYAGFLSYADHHVGRVFDAMDELGILDDTLVYYILGDNGASPEGTIHGTFSEMISINYRFDIETPEFLASKIDELGGPTCYNHYAIGWAHAMCTPFQWTKQVASHWGGTRNGTIVHWPSQIQAKGEMRSQFCHVIDVATTILDLAGIPEPTTVHGVTQEPLHGTSMRYTFDDATAEERHRRQYFELYGNRGIYHEGWTAVAIHRYPNSPGITNMTQGLTEDRWELYAPDDWSQAHDVAADHPDKLRELQDLFLMEAATFNVFPLDDRKAERLNAEIAGRPELITGNVQMLYPSMRRLPENTVLNIKNKSFSVTAQVELPDGRPARGTIVAQGGAFGGWGLFVDGGALSFCYNLLGVERFTTTGDAPLTPGAHQLRAEFAYDGGGLGKGGEVTLYVDGAPVGTGRVDSTQPFIFSGDETTDVGIETGTTVSDAYDARDSKFTGTIKWVRLETGLDSHDHLIDPEHLVHIAMMRE